MRATASARPSAPSPPRPDVDEAAFYGRGGGHDGREEVRAAEAAERLPEGVADEWTHLSDPETKAGRAAYLIFRLSVLFAPRALAAEFKIRSLP